VKYMYKIITFNCILLHIIKTLFINRTSGGNNKDTITLRMYFPKFITVFRKYVTLSYSEPDESSLELYLLFSNKPL
jgi:hypothetical protein